MTRRKTQQGIEKRKRGKEVTVQQIVTVKALNSYGKSMKLS